MAEELLVRRARARGFAVRALLSHLETCEADGGSIDIQLVLGRGAGGVTLAIVAAGDLSPVDLSPVDSASGTPPLVRRRAIIEALGASSSGASTPAAGWCWAPSCLPAEWISMPGGPEASGVPEGLMTRTCRGGGGPGAPVGRRLGSSRAVAVGTIPADIGTMVGFPLRLVDAAARLGVEAVHEPVLAFARAGRLDLERLMRELQPVSSSPLSHRVRVTMRIYLHPRRPDAATLILDGATLGAEVPFDEGAWCVVEAGGMTIYSPHVIPDTAGVVAVGRRLGDVVSIAGVEPFHYPVDRALVEAGEAPGSPPLNVLHAPVPILRFDGAPVAISPS